MRHRQVTSDRAVLQFGMRSSSRTMLIAFGGIDSRLGIPPFEFLTFAEALRAKRVFVRDVRQAWYHRGLAGHGDCIASVAAALRELAARRRVERLVCCGNSAGGYAALLFGTLLRADVVLAFAPQTTLDPDELGRMGDHRWDEQIGALVSAGQLDPCWTDLRAALPLAQSVRTRYRVFFDHTHTADRRHAERLIGLPGLQLYRFGAGGHALVRELRECQALGHVLGNAMEPSYFATRRRLTADSR
jgi:hypothetical protein